MLTLRTLRNLWYRDHDGVMTKPVNDDDYYDEEIDVGSQYDTDDVPNVPTFEDVVGVTLTTPTFDDGIVSFNHHGTGSAVLKVADVNTPLVGAPLATDHFVSIWSPAAMGTGVAAGDVAGAAAVLYIVDGTLAPITSFDGMYVHVTYSTGETVRVGPLVYNTAGGYYDTLLLDDLPIAHDMENTEALGGSSLISSGETYHTTPRELRIPLRFVDPSDSNQDDYA